MEFDKQSIPGSYNVCRQKAKYSVQVVIVWAIKFTFGYSFFYMGTWQFRCLQVVFNYSNINYYISYLALCCVYNYAVLSTVFSSLVYYFMGINLTWKQDFLTFIFHNFFLNNIIHKKKIIACTDIKDTSEQMPLSTFWHGIYDHGQFH